MNRKQVLKDMKKNKKKENIVEDNNYANRIVFTIFVLLIVFIAGYLIIGIFVNKSITFGKKDKEEKEEVTIDNNVILAGQIFDQKEDEYYVLVYDKSDTKSILSNWKNVYSNKEDALKVYEVDSKEKLNSNYIVDKDSNKTPTNYSDLKIKSPTLIKVSNKSVSEYTEGEDEIKNIFKK